MMQDNENYRWVSVVFVLIVFRIECILKSRLWDITKIKATAKAPRIIGFGVFGRERDHRGGSDGNRRWSYFRPNLAMATQEQIPFDEYHLCYFPDSAEYITKFEEDIRAVLEQHKRSESFRLVTHPLEITDGYDFGETLKVLEDYLKKQSEEIGNPENQVWHLNVGTSTHAMQFALYFLADKRWFPFKIHLQQPKPGICKSNPDICGNQECERQNRSCESKDNPRDCKEKRCICRGCHYQQSREKACKDRCNKKADICIALRASLTHASALKEIYTDWTETPYVESAIQSRRESYVSELLPTGKTFHRNWHKQLEKIGMVGCESDEPILLLGETGTGKSALAEKVHELWAKNRRQGEKSPFIATNCSGLIGELARSELFGHRKGSYSGATEDREGLFAKANNGTLFLGEIGELDLRTQAMLLKVLDNGEYSRIGDEGNPKKVKVRLICATNRDLAEEVREKRFRLDLYARIRNSMFAVPSLRELRGDLESLIPHALKCWQESKRSEHRAEVHFLEKSFHQYLKFANEAAWPGNHRDLLQSVGRMALWASCEKFGGKNVISAEIVRGEIEDLQLIWRMEKQSGLPAVSDITEAFIQDIKSQYPDLSLAHAAELCLQDWLLEKTDGNRAEVGRELYLDQNKKKGNASDTFRRRRDIISEGKANRKSKRSSGEAGCP